MGNCLIQHQCVAPRPYNVFRYSYGTYQFNCNIFIITKFKYQPIVNGKKLTWLIFLKEGYPETIQFRFLDTIIKNVCVCDKLRTCVLRGGR